MGPYKNRPLEQGLSEGKQKRGRENGKNRAPKVQSPGWGTGEFKKKDPPPHIVVKCGDFLSVPVCPKANTTLFYPYPYFPSSLLVFTLGHVGPRILQGPAKNPRPAPPRRAGRGIIFFSTPPRSQSTALHFRGPGFTVFQGPISALPHQFPVPGPQFLWGTAWGPTFTK